MHVLPTAMLIFPKNERRYPIPFVITKVALFFNAKAHAERAD
jgi:hypothetical protein